jgi:hypothetical protein
MDLFHAAFRSGRRGRLVLTVSFLFVAALGAGSLVRAIQTAGAAASATLAYSTYLGGGGADEGRCVAVDNSGNIYVVGETESDDFLGFDTTPNGFSDIFVAKFDPTGQSLLYLTTIGSSETDKPLSIQVDGAGNAYVTVNNYADDFPLKNALWTEYSGYWQNGALFKLDANGGLVYSTPLPLDVFEADANLAVDAAGNAYVTGMDFRDDMGNQIGLLKISPSGAPLLLEKYIGGPDAERGTAIALDAAGNIYLAGTTESGESFPVTANGHSFPLLAPIQSALAESFCTTFGSERYCFDNFVTTLSPTGGLAFSTYLGDAFDEFPYGVEVAPSGAIYLTGASDFPVTANAFQPDNQLGDDGILVKIDSGVVPPPPPYGDYNAFVPSVLR